MPAAGLKIAQKGLKKHVFCQNFAEAPSLARVWVGYLGFCGGSKPPQTPRTRMCARSAEKIEFLAAPCIKRKIAHTAYKNLICAYAQRKP